MKSMHTLVLIQHHVERILKIKNMKRGEHSGETVETLEVIVETLGET